MTEYQKIRASICRRATTPGNYRIEMINRKTMEEIPMALGQNWYGIMFDMAVGIALGYLHGTGRKTATMQIWEIDKDGNKLELVRCQD